MTDTQLAHYRALLAATDPDALHDLIVRYGASILDRDLPYLIVAVRNRQRSSLRRNARRLEMLSRKPPEPEPEEASLWDPVARALAHETLRELAEALAELPLSDALVLWGHASGGSDKEIIRQWDRLGLAPPEPSTELIRKRRERAGARLRERLKAETPEE